MENILFYFPCEFFFLVKNVFVSREKCFFFPVKNVFFSFDFFFLVKNVFFLVKNVFVERIFLNKKFLMILK